MPWRIARRKTAEFCLAECGGRPSGARGCYLASVEHSQWIPAPRVTPVDTTAAGDTFNGAFACALAEGANELDAAAFANSAASLSVTRRGAQSSIPTREEVDRIG